MHSTGEDYVLAFSGPTMPSKAEFTMCEKLGFVPSIANMGILSSACCLGLNHSASYYGGKELQELQVNQILWILSFQLVPIPRIILPNLRGIMHTPSSPDHLEELALAYLKYSQKITFIVTEGKVSEFFTVIDTLHFDRLPYLIHFTEEKVLIIEGKPVLLNEGNHIEMMYPYFLSNLLNCSTMIILDSCHSLSDSNSWIRVTKHCGLASYNPLFGKNIDKWGVRFPDMSLCYSYNPNWDQELNNVGVTIQDGGVIHTSTERPITTPAVLKIAAFLEAKGVVQHGVYAAIISQHKLETQQSRRAVYFAYPSYPTHTQFQVFSELVKKQVDLI